LFVILLVDEQTQQLKKEEILTGIFSLG